MTISQLKLLAIDLDGTMLRSDGSLSPRVRTALHNAVDAGIHVVPATGRPSVVAADVIEASNLDQFWIFGNGAVTRHLAEDKLVRGFWMESDTALQLIKRIRQEAPGSRFAVEFEQTLAFEAGFESVVPNPPPFGPTDDLAAAVIDHPGLVQKLLVFDHSLHIGDLLDLVGVAAGTLAVPSYSGLPFIELAPKDVNKGMALALLAADLGLQAAEVGAIGDNFNDLSMLEWAGTGYVMGNAVADVQESADIVLPSNDDDGVAVLVEQLLADQN